MSSEWFREWFETDEYLNVYRHRNESDAEDLVKLISGNIELFPNAAVLDMACGTGRHSMLFAKNGFNVTAVDLSKKMISTASQKAKDENLKINFLQSDLRQFAHNGKFDLIVNLFTSFGYFQNDEDNFKIFEIAYNQLHNNGYFVLDYFNKYYLEKNLVPYSKEKILDYDVIQYRRIEGQRVIKEIIIKDNGQTKNYLESVKMFSKTEIINELMKTGFAIEKTFGDFQGNTFDEFESSRIIIIAKK